MITTHVSNIIIIRIIFRSTEADDVVCIKHPLTNCVQKLVFHDTENMRPTVTNCLA